MVAIDRVGYVYPSIHLQEMLKLAQKPAALSPPSSPYYGQTASNDPMASMMNGDFTQKISPSQFGLDPNNPSLQFSTPGGGFVQVFGPLQTPGNDKFFHDPNPVVIQKKSKPITYVQKINLAYYKPPAPPAPGPVIIKEVSRSKRGIVFVIKKTCIPRFAHLKHPLHHHSTFASNHRHRPNKHRSLFVKLHHHVRDRFP